MHCVLIDNGSSTSILYWFAYQKLGVDEIQLQTKPILLVGFAEETIIPVGSVLLLVLMRMHPIVLNTMVNFLVINSLKEAPTYNVIIRRTIVCEIQATTSIYYLKLKFPTSFGVGELYGNQKHARSCYNVMLKGT